MPRFLGGLVGTPFQAELLMMTIIGLVNSILDWRSVEWTNNLEKIWNLSLPENIENNTPLIRSIKYILVWIVVARTITTYLYTVTYLTNFYAILTLNRSHLLLPWMVVSFFKNLILELTVLSIAILLYWRGNLTLVLLLEFVVVKITSLGPSIYKWYSVLCFYIQLRLLETRRATKTRRSRSEALFPVDSQHLALVSRKYNLSNNIIDSYSWPRSFTDSEGEALSKSLTTLYYSRSREVLPIFGLEDPYMTPMEKSMRLLGLTYGDVMAARIRSQKRGTDFSSNELENNEFESLRDSIDLRLSDESSQDTIVLKMADPEPNPEVIRNNLGLKSVSMEDEEIDAEEAVSRPCDKYFLRKETICPRLTGERDRNDHPHPCLPVIANLICDTEHADSIGGRKDENPEPKNGIGTTANRSRSSFICRSKAMKNGYGQLGIEEASDAPCCFRLLDATGSVSCSCSFENQNSNPIEVTSTVEKVSNKNPKAEDISKIVGTCTQILNNTFERISHLKKSEQANVNDTRFKKLENRSPEKILACKMPAARKISNEDRSEIEMRALRAYNKMTLLEDKKEMDEKKKQARIETNLSNRTSDHSGYIDIEMANVEGLGIQRFASRHTATSTSTEIPTDASINVPEVVNGIRWNPHPDGIVLTNKNLQSRSLNVENFGVTRHRNIIDERAIELLHRAFSHNPGFIERLYRFSESFSSDGDSSSRDLSIQLEEILSIIRNRSSNNFVSDLTNDFDAALTDEHADVFFDNDLRDLILVFSDENTPTDSEEFSFTDFSFGSMDDFRIESDETVTGDSSSSESLFQRTFFVNETDDDVISFINSEIIDKLLDEVAKRSSDAEAKNAAAAEIINFILDDKLFTDIRFPIVIDRRSLNEVDLSILGRGTHSVPERSCTSSTQNEISTSENTYLAFFKNILSWCILLFVYVYHFFSSNLWSRKSSSGSIRLNQPSASETETKNDSDTSVTNMDSFNTDYEELTFSSLSELTLMTDNSFEEFLFD